MCVINNISYSLNYKYILHRTIFNFRHSHRVHLAVAYWINCKDNWQIKNSSLVGSNSLPFSKQLPRRGVKIQYLFVGRGKKQHTPHLNRHCHVCENIQTLISRKRHIIFTRDISSTLTPLLTTHFIQDKSC
jgi:hypothetical protein